MKKIVLFICALISIYSCNTKKKETDLNKMGLKGEVVFVLPETWSFFDKILEFDVNGNLTRSMLYTEIGNTEIQFWEESFLIDSSNKLIRKITSNYSNIIDNKYYADIFEYDYQRGMLISVTSRTNPNFHDGYDILERYKYEEDKLIEIKKETLIKSEKRVSSIEITSFYYNENNILDSTLNIILNGDGVLESKVINTYLQNGLLRSEKKWHKVDNISNLYLTEFLYNDKNDKIEKKFTDLQKNSILFIEKYVYVYDTKNNWIERLTTRTDKEESNYVFKRKIFYKGQNYSEFIAKYDLFKLKYKSTCIGLDGSTPQSEKGSPSVQVFQSQDNENKVSINISQQQEKRKCYSCNGTGQCPKCSKPQRVRYKQGESPNDHNEIRQGMIVCTQCGGNLMNFGADKNKSCYLCKASGWLYCPECNNSGNGSNIGKCKRCKGTGFDR